ncbi:PDZ domain-containing protein [Flavobacterium sp. CYK-55]|uniref:PDZ domain-containing protein n=1 Tax=Flavobacterium sp. CYK-55 TaxID=2835529 RepID=UPI001BCC22DE|nr:PDZ domain-containing protein [Flavobacterium sp. CYK-55]MBS7787768.1 PDZ domain-containing protein [Flavobacterium sp. CYK-55]
MKLRISFILSMILATSLLMAQEGFEFEPQKNKAVIPFKLINNLMFIEVQVNGVPLSFLLDSGVEETILLSLEDKAEVRFNQVEKIKLRGLGSSDAIEGLKSSDNIVSFGGFKDEHHDLYIVLDQDFNFSSHIGIPVNGIIGYHFFKNHLVQINYSKQKITVYKDAVKAHQKFNKKFELFPITIEKAKPYLAVNILLNNQLQSSKMLIDTGNSDALWVFQNAKPYVKVPEPNFDEYLGRGFSGDINGKRARISGMQIGSFNFHQPIVSFPDSVSVKSVNLVPDRRGSVGGELLKRFDILLDYSNQTIALKKSKYFNEPFNYNMSGIELQNEGFQWVPETVQLTTAKQKVTSDKADDKAESFKYKFSLKPVFSIAGIRKNSPAEKCGLQKGDIIMSINGAQAYKYTLQKINQMLKTYEGKTMYFTVERAGKNLEFQFELQDEL